MFEIEYFSVLGHLRSGFSKLVQANRRKYRVFVKLENSAIELRYKYYDLNHNYNQVTNTSNLPDSNCPIDILGSPNFSIVAFSI